MWFTFFTFCGIICVSRGDMMDDLKKYDILTDFIDVAVCEVQNAFSLNDESSERFRNAFSEIAVDDILFGKSNYTANGEEMYSIQGDSKFVSLNVMTALNRAQLSSFMNSDASIDLVLIPMNADTMAQALILKSQSMIQEESKKFIR